MTFEEAKQEIRDYIKSADIITNLDEGYLRGWKSAFIVALEILELVTDMKHE